jgi:uncharacterized protein
VNAVAPEPVTNREFTQRLAKAVARPAWAWAPAIGLRWVLGEMAEAVLLSSVRVVPGRLTASGFRFYYPTLEAALGSVVRG